MTQLHAPRPSPAIFLTALLLSGSAFAQNAALTVGRPEAAVPQKPAAVPHKLATAAFAAGALTCAKRINDVANYLGGTNPSGALLFPPAADADRRPLSASLEIDSGGQTAYASASFSPGPEGSCESSYDAVMWWPNNCDTVARQNFAALKTQQALHQKIRVLDGGAWMKVFLLPAGSGCMSIKKEVIR